MFLPIYIIEGNFVAISIYPIFQKVIPVQADPSFKVDGTAPMSVADTWKFNPIRMQPYQPSLVATSTGSEDIDRCLDLCKKMEKYDPGYRFRRSDAIINFYSFISSLKKIPAGLSPAQKLEHAFQLFQDMGFVYEESASLGYGLANKKYNCAVFCVIFKSIEKEMGLPENSLSIVYPANCGHVIIRYNGRGNGHGKFYFDQGSIIPASYFEGYRKNLYLQVANKRITNGIDNQSNILVESSYNLSPYATCMSNAVATDYPLTINEIRSFNSNEQCFILITFINRIYQVARWSEGLKLLKEYADHGIVAKDGYQRIRNDNVRNFSRLNGVSGDPDALFKYAKTFLDYLRATYPKSIDGYYLLIYSRLKEYFRTHKKPGSNDPSVIVQETINLMRPMNFNKDDITRIEVYGYLYILKVFEDRFDVDPDPELRTKAVAYMDHIKECVDNITDLELQHEISISMAFEVANISFDIFTDITTYNNSKIDATRLLIHGSEVLDLILRQDDLDQIDKETYISLYLKCCSLSAPYCKNPAEILNRALFYEEQIDAMSPTSRRYCLSQFYNIYSLLGVIASNEGDTARSIDYMNKALDFIAKYRKTVSNPYGEDYISYVQATYDQYETQHFANIGNSAYLPDHMRLKAMRNNFEQIMDNFRIRNNIQDATSSRFKIARCNLTLARMEIIFMNNGSKALAYLDEARKVRIPCLDAETYYLMSIAYKMTGDKKNAEKFAKLSSDEEHKNEWNPVTSFQRINMNAIRLLAQK